MDSDSGSEVLNESAKEEVYIYCVQPLCALCKGEMGEGDDAIAVKNNGSVSGIFQLTFYNYAVDGTLLKYSAKTGSHALSVCHANEHATACHSVCFSLSQARPQRGFIRALESSFEPTLSEKKSRHRWLQSHLVSALSSWSHLPLELCNQISVYLVGEYSLILAENLWRKHPSTSTRFGVTSTLYVTYTYLEGNVYIATLTNAPQTTDRHILYDPSTHPPANLIYIQEDHLGIRKVVFASLKDAPPNAQRSPGLWWHTLVIPEQDCIFTTKSDGLKLREVLCMETEIGVQRPVFDLPRPPGDTLRLFSLDIKPQKSSQSHRMASVEFNNPDTTGISVEWCNSPLSIRTHTLRDKRATYDTYESFDRSCDDLWCYVPMDIGEAVTEIWARRTEINNSSMYKSFVFKTDKGRSSLIGYSPHLLYDPYTWILVEVLDPRNGPSTMFFNTVDDMKTLAFTSPDPNPCDRRLSLSLPESPHPEVWQQEPYHHNSVPLTDIVMVTPCQGIHKRRKEVIGLLLHYSDNHVECVGQIRLDWLGSPVAIDASQTTLLLGFSKVQTESWLLCPYISEVRFSRPETQKSGEAIDWFEVPWRGTLEWWFSYRQVMVYHEGRTSPPTM